MNKRPRHPTNLAEYKPPRFLVDTINLDFNLDENLTQVKATIQLKRSGLHDDPLELKGVGVILTNLTIDGLLLSESDYKISDDTLTIMKVPNAFQLEITTHIHPSQNTSLEGLYQSQNSLCTQCEAEGFRKITYYLDRPDVMARFTTHITADKYLYPVLLSNGNRIAEGDLGDGRHWAKWEDPFPKPSYLFALVAGDLSCVENKFVTASKREVRLKIYVEHHNKDKCDHAMQAIKKAMRWDEEVYGLEYDLDLFMIVAVDDFNMGAMENKGLNIFNSKYVLADAQTATDTDYLNIESVIAHEYFHNWTGNRVTCRDWFQLSLKEGLTVFRDQEFSADTFSRPITRIDNVKILRATQFPEDAGPMAHPVRPSSYIEINNFYTSTIYNKGAEVIRMMQTLIGKTGFQKGMKLYFARHDGHAVTVEDFVSAMADSNQVDLSQFKRWYSQAGTPELTLTTKYSTETGRLALKIHQSCPDTPGQIAKVPFHIPLKLALFDEEGRQQLSNRDGQETLEHCLELREFTNEFFFDQVSKKPIISVLRDFSAPVLVSMQRKSNELALLARHDTDEFNRWDAGQQLATNAALKLILCHQKNQSLKLDEDFLETISETLAGISGDCSLQAAALSLPTETELGQKMDEIDVDAIHAVRQFMRRSIADVFKSELMTVMGSCTATTAYKFDARSCGQRRLKNVCLSYLMELQTDEILNQCYNQFLNADNMTDTLASFQILSNHDCPHRLQAIDNFYERFSTYSLTLDKWFSVQATSRLPNTGEVVCDLMRHQDFTLNNPNKVRALIGAFCFGNQVRFHCTTGSGYKLLADTVLDLDPVNPQIAARLLSSMSLWHKFDEQRKSVMKHHLSRVANNQDLSSDTYEIAKKSLEH